MGVVSTLKVNINREKEARMKKILGVKGDGEGGEQYFDASLKTPMRFERPKRKGFRFIEEGALVKKEKQLIQKIAEKAQGLDKEKTMRRRKRKKRRRRLHQAAEEAKLEAEGGVRKIEPKIIRREVIPDVEWWDM